MENNSMPRYLYQYLNMNKGEFRLGIMKVLSEDNIFYNVINEHGVKNKVAKSHVDDLSPETHDVILTKRNDAAAKECLLEYHRRAVERYKANVLRQLEEALIHEEKRAEAVRNGNIKIYSFDDNFEYKEEENDELER